MSARGVAAVAIASLLAAHAACTCAPSPSGEDAGGLSDSGVVWPNVWSAANSDPWLLAHHQQLQQLRPRVLLVNFKNGFSDAQAVAKFNQIAAAYREATRPHGAGDPFIDFQLAKVVNLRDTPPPAGYPFENSSKYPRTSQAPPFATIDYGAFFGPAFAASYGSPDGDGGFLNLCALIERGLVNELWMIGSGDVPDAPAWESIENKQRYDGANRKVPGAFDRCAGNGCFEPTVPACAASVRIAFINYNRGVGCFLESLGHSFEGMANSGALPWLRPYFRELAMFNLDTRYGLPFEKLYACTTADCVAFRDGGVDWSAAGRSGTIPAYLPACGNAHFPPNGRANYDTTNAQPVLSTCAHFGMHDAPDGGDLAQPYSAATIAPFEVLAPDCTGAWEIYWRQNWPGRASAAKDDAGQPMLNWWPFLYY